MNRIFIGYEPREHKAYQLAHASILATTSEPVLITPLVLEHLPFLTRPIERRGNQMWCPISDAPMSTEFAISRFAVPFLQKSGWALFIDCDFISVGDISELFELADNKYALMVVKHDYTPSEGLKMDGQVQTAYPRKNESSMMLVNTDHPANKRLTLEMLNTLPGRDLHRFCWLEDSEIGEIPKQWNTLVGVDTKEQTANARLLHFTLGAHGLIDPTSQF
jgi:hypothetical protein